MKPVVIIGLGAAGYAALMAVRKTAPNCEVSVLDLKESELFHTCGLPWALDGTVKPEGLLSSANIGSFKIKARAAAILPEEKAVMTDSGGRIFYDKLIIAVGSAPMLPDIPGFKSLLGRGVYCFSAYEDLKSIRSHIFENPVKHAAILGAGAVGLEAAASLSALGKKVSVFEAENSILSQALDEDMANQAADYMSQALGIDIFCNRPIKAFAGDNSLSAVEAGELFPAEICISAAGFKAETGLCRGTDIAADALGIAVNGSMETSRPDIYAAGDCAKARSVIDGEPVAVKLASSAYKQGTVSGISAAGGQAYWKGTAGAFATKIGDMEIAAAGFTSKQCRERGFEPVSGKIRTSQIPGYFSNESPVSVKVVADKKSGKLLGAQAVGRSGAVWRINTAALALFTGMDVEKFLETEHAYCPAVSNLKDPLFLAAEFCIRRLK